MEKFLMTLCVVLFSSMLSGMSGGGGGFVMTPYFLLMGLSPQQNIAVGSVIGLGLSGGSLFAARGTGLIRRQFLALLIGLAVIATIGATLVLPTLHANVSNVFVGWFMLMATPTLFVQKSFFAPGSRSNLALTLGYTLYTLLWFANAMFSAGFAALLFVPMLFCMGLTALEANITKRFAALAQAAVLFLVLAPKGLILWNYAFAGLLGAWIGGHTGTYLAIQRGEHFARIALVVIMVVSSTLLIGQF